MTTWLKASAGLVLGVLLFTAKTQAAGVVTTCDQAHLQTALNGGGLVIFNGDCTIFLTSTLNISANTTIDGSSHNVVLDGAGTMTVLSVTSGVALAINDLTVSNGSTIGNGGGIDNLGTLIVTNSTFSGNSAGQGGGIYHYSGTLLVANSTFSGNSANIGGGIFMRDGTLTVSNGTFSGNSAGFGGGIYSGEGMLSVTNSTFASNIATSFGGGIFNGNHTTLSNTIVIGSSAQGSDCSGSLILVGGGSAITDGGYNLDDDGSCGFNATGSKSNDTSVTFTSNSPQDNGGPTATLALTATDTDAIGVIPPGTNGCATTSISDQRGFARPGSLNGSCSMGAYEYVPPADHTITDCSSDTQFNAAFAAGGRIVFSCGSSPVTIHLTSGYGANGKITVDGAGNKITLDMSGSTGFYVDAAANVLTFNSLTFSKGAATVLESNFGTLIVTNCAVNDNNTQIEPHAIDVSFGTAIVSNCTISGNVDTAPGGNISNYMGTVIVTSSTIANNSGDSGIDNTGTMSLQNTLVVGNSSGNCKGTVTDLGYNLDDDGSCGFTNTGSLKNNKNAKLGTLSDNGGSSQTIPLLVGSSAIDAIGLGASGCGFSPDQRGSVRPSGPGCDIGAYEAQEIPVPFDTNPTDLSYSVNSVNYSSPQAPFLVVGGQYPISTTDPQTANSTTYGFTGWSDNLALSHSITVSATNLTNYLATFSPTGYLLTTQSNPGAAGTVNVLTPGNNGYYAPNTVVSLSVVSNVGYLFSSWTGSVANANSASTTVTMSQPQTVTANFGAAYKLTTGVNPSAGGTVSVLTAGSNGFYGAGTVVSISAQASAGYVFSGWSGSSDIANANAASTTITMNANESITASFSAANSATFLPLDTGTQGNWPGVYGGDGFIIANDAASTTPSYATVKFNNTSNWTWAAGGSDSRAPLVSPSSTNRIASTFYSGSTLSIDLTLTGGVHQIALYLLDYDTTSRAETITILNGDTQAAIDTRSFSNFHNGVYAVWRLSGHVIIQVANNGGLNAVVSGFFFSTLNSPPPGPVVTIYSPTSNQTVTGTITLSANVTAQAGVQNVQFVLDNATSLSPLIPGDGATYTYQWNSASVNNGVHSLKVIGTDNLSQTGSSTVSFTVNNPGTPSATAMFQSPADTTTQGNWPGVYGQDGFLIANDPTSAPPVYAAITFTGSSTWTWNGSTGDPRALLSSPTGTGSTRIASTYYSNSSFTIDLNLTDNQAHLVALYLLDYDDGRSESIAIVDANNPNGPPLSTQSASNFQNGEYLVWKIQGHVQIQVATTGGLNGVVSGLFFSTPSNGQQPRPAVTVTSPTSNQQISGQFKVQATATSSGSIASLQFYVDSNPVGPAIAQGVNSTYSYTLDTTTLSNTTHMITAKATDNLSQSTTSSPVSFVVSNATVTNKADFLSTDTSTQGNWRGVYGAAGEIIANDSNAPPSYGVVNFSGASQYTWAFTPDPRALQTAASSANHIASTYYASPGFSIDVNFTDGNAHSVALYLLDWDHAGRAENIKIVDGTNMNSVLDIQSSSNFANGTYLVWNITGHAIIQVTGTAGPNAVVSGVFFQ